MLYPILMSVALTTTAGLGMDAGAWRSINDGVMGGRSSGGMSGGTDGLRFAGRLSLENNGGFSSVRRLVEQDLSQATHVRLEVRGDGRDYQFRIRQNNRFDGVAWRAVFPTNEQWQVVEIPLAEFVPVFRGMTVRDAGPVSASMIEQIGFLLADKNAGRFELEIRRIEFLTPNDSPAS
jgi:monofunctional biosynthetic peptidoglycan transglycosylase